MCCRIATCTLQKKERVRVDNGIPLRADAEYREIVRGASLHRRTATGGLVPRARRPRFEDAPRARRVRKRSTESASGEVGGDGNYFRLVAHPAKTRSF